jgi:tRNA threonylcarbamoyladenosine biosynthesis protein TsaE
MTASRSSAAEHSPPGEPWAVELRSESPDQTRLLGERLGALLQAGDVVLLHGALGAGKTALTQGIGRGLGVAETVNSPTFTLLKEHVGRLPLYHFDLYRLDEPGEVEALGFEQYFDGDGVCVVEWAERGEAPSGASPWPADYLRILLMTTGEESRLLRCSARGPRGHDLLAAFAAATTNVQG